MVRSSKWFSGLWLPLLLVGVVMATSVLDTGCSAKRVPASEEDVMTDGEETPQDGEIVEPGDSAEDAMRTEKAESMTPAPTDLRSVVNRLEADVAKLQAESQQTKEQIAAVGARVDKVESNLTQTTQQILQRFSNFDAELARIRQGETPISPTAGNRDVAAEVAMAVDSWRQAWQQKDMAAYLRLYHPEARISRGYIVNGGTVRRTAMGPAELQRRMTRLVRNYARMEVLVRNFRVTPEGNRVIARFDQEFSGWARARDLRPVYSDRGMKTLGFVEQNKVWVIVQEDWEPLRK